MGGFGAREWFYESDQWYYANTLGVDMLTWGMEMIFITILIMWAIAFNHDADWAKYYFRTVQWLVPASWAVALVANLAFFIAAIQGDDPIMLLYPFIYDLFFFAIGSIIYWGLGDGNVNFYRWNEMSWWRQDGDW